MTTLFPLTHISPGFNGYFMDRHGDVWSKRKTGSLLKLAGSMTSSGRYITLQNNLAPAASRSQTEKLSTLQARCARHPEWADWLKTQLPKAAVVPKTDLATAMGLRKAPALPTIEFKPTAKPAVARHHASSVDHGIRARGWVIARVHQGTLQLGVEPVIHTFESSVDDEMERLAGTQRGVKFVKLQIQGATIANGVSWE